MINHILFKEIKNSNSKILVVTKYWDKKIASQIISEINKDYSDIVFWIWENKIESIIKKDISRENMHFIWNIQSKKLQKIITSCSTIHSLQNLKHAEIIDKYSKKIWVITKVFLQINLDSKKHSWLNEIELEILIKDIEKLKNMPWKNSYWGIEILWISGMWAWIFTHTEKQKEFKLLKNLRDKYLPWKLISAWTSRDYKIALKNHIEVVRIGSKILEV